MAQVSDPQYPGYGGGIPVAKVLTDEESLKRDFDPEPVEDREPTSFAICFNKSCDDYRVRRDASVPCQCKTSRRPVKGAGSSPGWY